MKYIEGIKRERERERRAKERGIKKESAKSENCSAVMKNVDHN